MPPAVARELAITYGGFVVGGASERLLDEEPGQYRIEKDFTSASVEYSFVIQKELEADFAAEIAAVEAAFRTPRQDFTMVQGAATLLSLSQTANTGFDADPSIIKFDDIGNTGRSRVYTVRIDFGLPADNIGTAGRQSSIIGVEFDASNIRTVTISGVYTALVGVAARAQYEAEIDAYVASVLAALGGVYELISQTADNFETDKNLEFSRTFRELVADQAGGAGSPSDNPAIASQIFTVTRKVLTPGDSDPATLPETIRLVEFDISYEANIDATVTTDIVALWDDTIRPFIIAQVEAIANGAVAIIEDFPSFTFDNNTISASMLFTSSAAIGLVEFERTEETILQEGLVFVPAWTGDPFAKFEYQGPATLQQTITARGKEIATRVGAIPFVKANEVFPRNPPGGTRRRTGLRERRTPRTIGPIDAQFDVVEFEIVATYEFFTPLVTQQRLFTSVDLPFGERQPGG